LALMGLATWAEINRREAVAQKVLTDRAFERASRSSNELIGELAQPYQSQEGIPQALIVDLLKKAEELVDGLSSGGAANPDVERSLGVALVELSSKFLERGSSGEALDVARRAVTIFQRLVDTSPSQLDRRADLLAALDRLGDALAQSGDNAAASPRSVGAVPPKPRDSTAACA
jgi:hypothetical protein